MASLFNECPRHIVGDGDKLPLEAVRQGTRLSLNAAYAMRAVIDSDFPRSHRCIIISLKFALLLSLRSQLDGDSESRVMQEKSREAKVHSRLT